MNPVFIYDPITKYVWDIYGWHYESYETEEEFLKNYPNGIVDGKQ